MKSDYKFKANKAPKILGKFVEFNFAFVPMLYDNHCCLSYKRQHECCIWGDAEVSYFCIKNGNEFNVVHGRENVLQRKSIDKGWIV